MKQKESSKQTRILIALSIVFLAVAIAGSIFVATRAWLTTLAK